MAHYPVRSRGAKPKALQILIPLLLGVIFLATNVMAQDVAGTPEKPLPYTGLIKNNTKYDLSIPSLNSGGTLIVPAKSTIEYTVWSPSFELDAYHNGTEIWCEKISVTPDKFQHMCKKYDFMAEIVKAEPEHKPVHKKRHKRPRGEGVEALG